MANIQQSDGNFGTARVEFAYGNDSYRFNLNPQNITSTTPHRTTVVKTQTQYVVEDFNDDVQTIVISGTTGGPRSGGGNAIINLWNFLDRYSNSTPSYGQAPKDYLTFFNHTDNYAWATVLGPGGYKIERDVSHPLMWNYEINLVVIGNAGSTVDASQISGAEVSTTDTNKEAQYSGATSTGPTTGVTAQAENRIHATVVPVQKVKKSKKKKAKKRKNGFSSGTASGALSGAGTTRAIQTLGG